MSDSQKPLTYAESGVDIDVGNRIVDRIRPFARGTRRPGAGADLGGFGGLFDLKAAGFVDPILVAANDGVGTKVKIAIESGLYDTIGIDLVAMCVNDIVVQVPSRCFFGLFCSGKLDEARVGCGAKHRRRVHNRGARPWRYGRRCPALRPGDFDLAGFAVGAAERGTLLPRPGLKPGDLVFGLPSSGVHSNGFRWCGASSRGQASREAPPLRSVMPLAAASGMPTRLCADAHALRTRGIHASPISWGGYPDNCRACRRRPPSQLDAFIRNRFFLARVGRRS